MPETPDEKPVSAAETAAPTHEQRRSFMRQHLLLKASYHREEAVLLHAQAAKQRAYAAFCEHRASRVQELDERTIELMLADWLAADVIEGTAFARNNALGTMRRDLAAARRDGLL